VRSTRFWGRALTSRKVASRSHRARLNDLAAKLETVLASRGLGAAAVATVVAYSDDEPANVEALKAKAGKAGMVVVIQKLCQRPAASQGPGS
jgi:hypothetical protein